MQQDHDDHDRSLDHDPDHDHNHNVNKTSGPPATPRWNPTKEQINMLEGLYRQGIRTPTAEQIQQITTRLRAFGHIEGKNVFYWFQNHKARLRQKQKQENVAYINRFLHRSNTMTTQPVFPPTTSHHIPCPNVCATYYVPVQTQTEPIGALHHQSNKLPLSIATRTASRRSPRLEKFPQKTRVLSGDSEVAYDRGPRNEFTTLKMMTMIGNNPCTSNQETLPLFPLRPTGVLQGNDDQDHHDFDHGSAENTIEQSSNAATSRVVEEGGSSSGGGVQPFYDFFSR